MMVVALQAPTQVHGGMVLFAPMADKQVSTHAYVLEMFSARAEGKCLATQKQSGGMPVQFQAMGRKVAASFHDQTNFLDQAIRNTRPQLR